MSSTQTPADGEINGEVLMYQSPEPLNPEHHGALGLTRSDKPWGFASAAHAVPLQVTEFGPASLSYPIIFAGDTFSPLAVMSIRQNENLYITADGTFDPEAYIPAFMRRYPFVLANDEAQKRLVVCIDRKAPFLSPRGEIKLFEKGELSEYSKNAVKFLEDFEGERVRTENFVKILRDLDLFETRKATYTPRDDQGQPGEPVQIADYFAVSEEKLGKLPAAKLVELRDTGALQQVYIHLNSLFGWDRLITRTLVRAPVPPANA